jgi:ribonuclease HI
MIVRKFLGYFDGACEPVNPGGTMGFGAVVTENGEIIWQAAGLSPPGNGHGPTSNNVAEYVALLALLDHFIEAGLTDCEIEVRGDSKLVVEQMTGNWQISQGLYVQTARQAQRRVSRFSNLRFLWIPREHNHLADALSKSELVKAGIGISSRRSSA